MNERRIDVDGLSIRCFVAGEAGSSVILLHGGGLDSAALSWGDTIMPLAAQHRVVAPDLPGYGESDKPDITYSMAYYVDFVPRLMDVLGLERASFVGISLGGGIALGLALRHADRVDKLVAVAPYGIAATYPFHKLSYLYAHSFINPLTFRLFASSRGMIRWSLEYGLLKDRSRVTDALVDTAYATSRAPNSSRAWHSFQRDEFLWSGVRTSYLDRLGEIHAPTLYVNGDQDPLVLASTAEQAQRLTPNARLHILHGAGHWAQRDNPEEFERVVLDFLSATT